MKVLQFPLTRVSLCFIAGIIIAHYGRLAPDFAFFLLYILFFVFCIAYFFQRNKLAKSYFGIAVFILSFFTGVVTLSMHNSYFQHRSYIYKSGSSEAVHSVDIILRERLKSSVGNDRFFALVKSIDGKPADGKILVNFHKGQFRNLIIGTNLRLWGKIYKLKAPNNPDQFDYSEYLRNKSVLAQMYVGSNNARIGKRVERDAFYYSDLLRTRILNNLGKHHFHKKELAVIGALILGQQQDIAPEILQDYQFAGAIHILSVSGLHVGFLLLFINFLLNFLPKNKTTSYVKSNSYFPITMGICGSRRTFAFRNQVGNNVQLRRAGHASEKKNKHFPYIARFDILNLIVRAVIPV
jgi:competence protein ComEC